jgi:glutathionyl-hydroquinone reductase
MATEQAWHNGPNDSWHGAIVPGGRFSPERDRYHLYIGYFCPFAHRANLVRVLKGLDKFISLSVVKPFPKGDDKGWPGWKFAGTKDPYPDATEDHLFGYEYMHQVYFRADKDYKGRYSVPVIWDKKDDTIVNNESLEILRWLQTGLNELLPENSPERLLNLYPGHLQGKIDQVQTWMTRDLNSGVYKAGFATDQETYDRNVPIVFAALNQLELLIHKHGGPYVLGGELTELDILAYATVVRFDAVYVQHFKCNLGTIRHDYPVTHEWLKNLYWNTYGFKETTNFRHIKENVGTSPFGTAQSD